MRRPYCRGEGKRLIEGARRQFLVPSIRVLTFLLILPVSMGKVHAQEAVQIEVTGNAHGEGALISLTGAEIPVPSIRRSGSELLLTFGRAIEISLAGMPPNLPAVESVTYGYDSFLVRSSTPAVFDVKITDARINVAVLPRRGVQPEDQAGERRRIDLARVRLLQRQGKRAEARMLAAQIVEANPNDADAIAALAAIETEIGRTRRALALYDRALALSPSNVGIRADRGEAERAVASFVSLEPRFIFEEGGDRQSIFMGQFQTPVDDTWRVLLGFDTNLVDVDPVVRPSGEIAAFDGTRHRGEMGVLHEWEQGNTAKLSLYGNAETLGVGGEFRLVEDDAITIFAAAYHQPTWEFTELIVNDGWRDRVLIGREQRLFERFSGRIAISGNQYGMEEVEDAASSIRLEGELSTPLGSFDSPYRLAYGLDAEYPSDKARIEGEAGDQVTVLDIRRREVHSLTIGYSAALGFGSVGDSPRRQIDAYGGWAVDRYGSTGPILGAAITLYEDHSCTFQLLADYVQDTGREGDTVLAVGGFARWRF